MVAASRGPGRPFGEPHECSPTVPFLDDLRKTMKRLRIPGSLLGKYSTQIMAGARFISDDDLVALFADHPEELPRLRALRDKADAELARRLPPKDSQFRSPSELLDGAIVMGDALGIAFADVAKRATVEYRSSVVDHLRVGPPPSADDVTAELVDRTRTLTPTMLARVVAGYGGGHDEVVAWRNELDVVLGRRAAASPSDAPPPEPAATTPAGQPDIAPLANTPDPTGEGPAAAAEPEPESPQPQPQPSPRLAPVPPARARRRWWSPPAQLAVGAAVLLVLALVAGAWAGLWPVAWGQHHDPAATVAASGPASLDDTREPDGKGPQRLLELADAARASTDLDPTPAGQYRYRWRLVESWPAGATPSDATRTATEEQTWCDAENIGFRLVTRSEPGKPTSTYPADPACHGPLPDPPSTDCAVLRGQLDHLRREPAGTAVRWLRSWAAVNDGFWLTPAQRAAGLCVLASRPGLRYDVDASDARNRPGIAVSAVDPNTGFRETLVFALGALPRTGDTGPTGVGSLLSYEVVETRGGPARERLQTRTLYLGQEHTVSHG
ncbi:hypothetical protein [Dactylosporangium salmoneum]|uniref:Uncharacterized protein n=1 Tax=Dactylosporangium salmoneum TaxID=53361 RepID=A0ABN3G102_9ACTN